MPGRHPTLRDILTAARTEFSARAVDSPRLCAEVLLAHVLGLDRTGLLLRMNDPMPEEAAARFEALAARRATGEPLAYILGEREFYGLDFAVTRATLIPRPETELVIDRALELFSRQAPLRFADLGTGSGCLAVTLAVHFPNASGVAVDLSAAALAVARENAVRHGVADRLEFLEGDFSRLDETAGAYDLIVSNPPYVTEAEMGELSREVADFEPHGALVSGPEGLDAIRAVAAIARRKLAPGGIFLMEMGCGQGEAVRNLLESPPLSFEGVTIHKDLAGLDRMAEGRAP